jgi:hypothetical protein
MGKLRKAGKLLADNFVDASGAIIQSTPIYGLVETLAGMPNEVSRDTRLLAAATFYAGMGFVWSKGRNLSQRLSIGKGALDKTIRRHDALYSAVFNLALCPALYLAAGATDWKDITLATIGSTTIGLVNGAPQGYAVDATRDLIGIQTCERTTYPDRIRKLGPKSKKTILAGAVAASIGLMGLIYALTPDEGLWKEKVPETGIEKVIKQKK